MTFLILHPALDIEQFSDQRVIRINFSRRMVTDHTVAPSCRGIGQRHQNQFRGGRKLLLPGPVHRRDTQRLARTSCLVGRPRRRGCESCVTGSATVTVNCSSQSCTAWQGHSRLRQPGGWMRGGSGLPAHNLFRNRPTEIPSKLAISVSV